MPTVEVGVPLRQGAVYIHESGAAGSPAIVFIHGGGPSGRMWRTYLERLAPRFQCLAPDLPGFGRSHHLGPLSLDETADLLAGIIRDRVPAQPAHVVGLSYGGSVVIPTTRSATNATSDASGVSVARRWPVSTSLASWPKPSGTSSRRTNPPLRQAPLCRWSLDDPQLDWAAGSLPSDIVLPSEKAIER